MFRFVSLQSLYPTAITITAPCAKAIYTPTNTPNQPKSIDPITLFHNPTLTSSTHALTVLKQAATIASETATEDQASDYTNHAKNQRSEFQLEVSSEPPTTDQLRNILDYASAEGKGKAVERKNYVPGEIVKGARDAEDALKRFKEDQNRFVRPIVRSPPYILSVCVY